jgi:hypothetical protein
LDRRLENRYITSYIGAIETDIEIPFGSTWIFNLRTNTKIVIRRIPAEGDPQVGYPSDLQIGYSTNQRGWYYIKNIEIDINLRIQRMPDKG